MSACIQHVMLFLENVNILVAVLESEGGQNKSILRNKPQGSSFDSQNSLSLRHVKFLANCYKISTKFKKHGTLEMIFH